MTAAVRRYTFDEYRHVCLFNERGGIKHEFFDGMIYAMTGASPEHSALAARIISLLSQHIRGPCRIYTSDLGIHTPDEELAAYPDASVICGEPELTTMRPRAALNPTLLVEVLSESTEDFDRGDKLRSFKKIPSLRAVLLVSQWEKEILVVLRTPRGWNELTLLYGDKYTLECLAFVVDVDQVYEGMKLARR